jgi:N-acetylmuramoyl-L-alanine amidase
VAVIAPPETIVSRPAAEPPVPAAASTAAAAVATIRDIKRIPLPDGVRVSIELDSESRYRYERLDNPRRVFFDLKGTRAPASLQDAVLKFDDDIVREIRLGRHPNNTTRIVVDMEQIETCNVFTLYNPFRLVVDFKRDAVVTKPAGPIANGLAPAVPGRVSVGGTPTVPADPKPATATKEKETVPAAREPVPLVSRPTAVAATIPTPIAPTTNSNGQFSLARQLGLGISRIVLDAGHGGHDPGARSNGIEEAELVLDVTLRLRDLLEKQPGIEVTLTRNSNEFIALEERTAIANRNGADLFLSIHANASRNPKARGIETYFLNFASNPEAEAVAARENSASGRTMHSLPEIVRAIALNNKIDESRDFADTVQKSMVRRLATRNKLVRDLGVKQAPFVVLIGAGMPSVLAEISFVTNKQEGALLKTPAYRQQIAESLFDAVVRYQRTLKGVRAVASRE